MEFEKQRRTRGKKLNLSCEDDICAQFYSPLKMDDVRNAHAANQAEEEQEKAKKIKASKGGKGTSYG
jgi:hypothetical protein